MNSSRDSDLEPEMFAAAPRRRPLWRWRWLPLLSGLVTVVLLIALSAASCDVAPADPADPAGVEVEDCDDEDRANREPECGFAPKVKVPAPKPKVSTKRRR